MKTLSQVVPEFEEDLFMSIEGLVTHIQSKLKKSKDGICFIISDYYSIDIVGANTVEITSESERAIVLEFSFSGTVISQVVIPKGKMYKVGLDDRYIEIIEGIDYGKDKYCGDIVRVN